MLTMGIIGFGKSANRYHLPYLRLRKNIRVKTIYNPRPKPELEQLPENQGIQFTQELADLLNDPEVQLVSICSPASTHYEIGKQALLAGKNVIIEKPFCETLEEAKELLAIAKEQNLMVMPFQNRRFDGDYLAFKQVVEAGYLGDLVEVESHFDYYRPDTTAQKGTPVEGNFYGLGVHTIDRMLALFGRPKQVSYDIRSVRNPESVDDYFDVDLHYSENFKVKVKTSHLVAQAYPQFIVHGTKGSFIKYGIDQQENDLKAGIMPGTPGFGQDSPMYYGKVRYQNANGDWIEKQIITPQGDYGRVYDAAYETIMNQVEPLVSAEQILTNIEILQAGFLKLSPSVYTLS